MTSDELKQWLEKLDGKIDQQGRDINEIKVNCAGRCGVIREAVRLAAAIGAGALAALGIKS